jgi:Skp family chaperone for outer membrane proteins
MWRFLAAGLVTVCGVVLLFAASFGDPQVILRDAQALLPVFQTRSTTPSTAAIAIPEVARTTPVPAPPGPDQLSRAPLSAPGPVPASTLSAAAALAPPATTAPVAPSAAAMAPPSVPGPGLLDAAALQQQRDELQKQLEALRAKVAEQRQAMESLRSEADTARHEIDTERQQLAADQATSDQTKKAEQRDLEANQQRATEAEAQVTAAQANLDRLKAQAGRLNARAEAPQIVKSGPSGQAVPQAGSVNLALNAPPSPKPLAPSGTTVQAGLGLPDAVLDRLRREYRSGSPAEQEQSDYRPAPPVAQPTAGAQEWLSDARAALATGRTDVARRLLENAQVQLVFRPVGPSDEASATSSVAAGQVAEALSMLGAGDVPHAIQYIDLAMARGDRVANEVQSVQRANTIP